MSKNHPFTLSADMTKVPEDRPFALYIFPVLSEAHFERYLILERSQMN